MATTDEAYERFNATAQAFQAAWPQRTQAVDAVGQALAEHLEAAQALAAALAKQPPTRTPLEGI